MSMRDSITAWVVTTDQLANEAGISLPQAKTIFNRVALRGFRNWKPTTVLISTQVVFWGGHIFKAHWAFGEILFSLLTNGSFIGGIYCSFFMSCTVAYPDMLAEAKRVRQSGDLSSKGE